jgi:hypothetical protein
MEIKSTLPIGYWRRKSRFTHSVVIFSLWVITFSTSCSTPSRVSSQPDSAISSPPPLSNEIQGPKQQELYPTQRQAADRTGVTVALLPVSSHDQWIGYLSALRTLREQGVTISNIVACGLTAIAKNFFESTSTNSELDWLIAHLKGKSVWSNENWIRLYRKEATLSPKELEIQNELEANESCLKTRFKTLYSQTLWAQKHPVLLMAYRANNYAPFADASLILPHHSPSSEQSFEKFKSEIFYPAKLMTLQSLSNIKTLLKP